MRKILVKNMKKRVIYIFPRIYQCENSEITIFMVIESFKKVEFKYRSVFTYKFS